VRWNGKFRGGCVVGDFVGRLKALIVRQTTKAGFKFSLIFCLLFHQGKSKRNNKN